MIYTTGQKEATRVLYFDIDGTINDYNDETKQRLRCGQLQKLLESKNFSKLICVSGWATMVRDAANMRPWLKTSKQELLEAVREVITDAFPDKEFFHSVCELCFENDDRCQHIDISGDWYYIDDWANEFAAKRWGDELPAEIKSRILHCDPYGDGSDVYDFILHTPQRINAS